MKTAGFISLVLLFTQSALAADIEVVVQTDKTSYSVGEDVVVFVTAFNPTDSEITLMFASSCQATYHMDGWFDYMHEKGCAWWITSVVIGPNDSHTWTMVHDSHERDYCPLYPGKHSVVGEVLSYGLSRSEPAEFEVVGEAPKIYVSTTGSDTTGDGSESNPFRTVQKGIDTAPYASIVVVKSGTYTGDGNRDISFNEKSIIVRSENGPQTCIIDCNGTADEPHRAFYFNYDQSRYAVLDGFTIANGYADRGGGIYCTYYSNPSIINCTISNNVAEEGAGIYCLESSPTITNCTIIGNAADSGGGICLFGSDPIISNCTLSGNSVRYRGGGICSLDSGPIIVDCILTGNTAYESGAEGAAISCSAGNPTIMNCSIESNWCGYHGGAIHCRGSSPLIKGCIIKNNTAVRHAGAIYCTGSSPQILGCIIKSNTSALFHGGGIYCLSNSNPLIRGCTIHDNSAWFGGGIFCKNSSPAIMNCHITDNIASGNGGAFAFYFSSPTISNCVIMGNHCTNWGNSIACTNATMKINQCTIRNNRGNWQGSIYCWGRSNITVNGSILWGNEGAEVHLVYYSKLYVSFSDTHGGLEGIWPEYGCTVDWGDGNLNACYHRW